MRNAAILGIIATAFCLIVGTAAVCGDEAITPVRSQDGNTIGYGTAFAIAANDKQSLWVTAAHCVERGNVDIAFGDRWHRASVVTSTRDKYADVALLKCSAIIPAADCVNFRIGESLQQGEPVRYTGYPHGSRSQRRYTATIDQAGADIVINKQPQIGVSGGPLMVQRGSEWVAVGVVSMQATRQQLGWCAKLAPLASELTRLMAPESAKDHIGKYTQFGGYQYGPQRCPPGSQMCPTPYQPSTVLPINPPRYIPPTVRVTPGRSIPPTVTLPPIPDGLIADQIRRVIAEDPESFRGLRGPAGPAGKNGTRGADGFPGVQGDPGEPGQGIDAGQLAVLIDELERLRAVTQRLEAKRVSVQPMYATEDGELMPYRKTYTEDDDGVIRVDPTRVRTLSNLDQLTETQVTVGGLLDLSGGTRPND